MKGTIVVSLTVALLVGLALGSALTYQFAPQTTRATYSTLTLTVQYVYYNARVLTCETVSGTAVTTYIYYPGTVRLTTIFNASLTPAIYVVTLTTTGAQTIFETEGSTPTC